MTREEVIKIFNTILVFGKCDCTKEEADECFKMAIEALKQEPCEDCISRQAVIDELNQAYNLIDAEHRLKGLTPVTPQQKMGHCKDCKYFEYDSVAKVDGIPLIVAHEICLRWGDGCKTNEDGYCFLFKPKM